MSSEFLNSEPSTLVRTPHILIVDDEVAMVRSLELLLRPLGQISKAYSVPEAEEILAQANEVDCVVTDVSMPEASGLDLLKMIRKKSPEIPVVVMTAYSSVPQAVDAMQRGAFKYLVKPFENSEMTGVVKKAISKKGIQYGEGQTLPKGWICNSRGMKDFVVKAEKMKESFHLLLLGETGVGKSRAARWIHEQSSRSKKDFFIVDGRSHDEDSPLLGSLSPKIGTIFVAEIFSLSKRLQDKLAEILEKKGVAVIGSSSSAPDVQMIPHFRKDLFEQLNTVSLKLPSLSERGDDFDALCQSILEDLSKSLRIKRLEIENGALQSLKSRVMPGNVDELERILERAALESPSGIVTEENLRVSDADLRSLLPFSVPIEEGWKRLELLHRSLESELINRALEKYPNYSNTQIATVLGTTRRILELRMKEYQIREGSQSNF